MIIQSNKTGTRLFTHVMHRFHVTIGEVEFTLIESNGGIKITVDDQLIIKPVSSNACVLEVGRGMDEENNHNN